MTKAGKSANTMPPDERKLRRAVLDAALEMSQRDLSPGRSGNVSARFRDGMLITPTGMSYEATTIDDVVFVAGDGSVSPGQRKPSSEWHFHRAAYVARPDRHAVVHTHSRYAVALACTGQGIPAFHYMVAVAGGRDIACVPYATFGTDELAKYVGEGLARRDACLMANHGQVAIGASLEAALELAFEVETLAAQYVAALQAGTPILLSDAEMDLMIEKFKTYGQSAQGT